MKTTKTTETILPKGVKRLENSPFLIGDPGSFISLENWDDFCANASGTGRRYGDSTEDETLSFINMGRGAVTWRGVTMLIQSTGGDGMFFGVPVDSGTVALVNEADLPRLA